MSIDFVKRKCNPMFSNISWFEYLTFIMVSALVYYVFVLFTYYRYDLLQILKAKEDGVEVEEKFRPKFEFQQEHAPGIHLKNPYPSPDISQIIQSFTDETAAYLKEAAKNKVAKENMLFSLGKITHKYPSLASSEFKESLNQFIINQTETYCAMCLNEEDLNKMWRDT